jgi:hypothetical protein
MSQRTAVRIDLCVYMDGLSSVGSVDCWKRERERETDRNWLGSISHVTSSSISSVQEQENNVYVRLGLDVEGCWAGRTRYLMIEEGLSPLMVGKT